jgi:hypothetical protein
MSRKVQIRFGEPAELWPLLTEARTLADNAAIYQRICSVGEVCEWVLSAEDQDLKDRRACTLITVASIFLANARKDWPGKSKSSVYENRYRDLAARLSKIHEELEVDALPLMRGYAEGIRRASDDAKRCADGRASPCD